jgi:hypothetical protein
MRLSLSGREAARHPRPGMDRSMWEPQVIQAPH